MPIYEPFVNEIFQSAIKKKNIKFSFNFKKLKNWFLFCRGLY